MTGAESQAWAPVGGSTQASSSLWTGPQGRDGPLFMEAPGLGVGGEACTCFTIATRLRAHRRASLSSVTWGQWCRGHFRSQAAGAGPNQARRAAHSDLCKMPRQTGGSPPDPQPALPLLGRTSASTTSTLPAAPHSELSASWSPGISPTKTWDQPSLCPEPHYRAAVTKDTSTLTHRRRSNICGQHSAA